jgi:hypothetical protein
MKNGETDVVGAACADRCWSSHRLEFPTSPRWQSPAASTTLPDMDTINPAPNDPADLSRPETEAERRRRLAWEAEMIAEADADIAAGRLIDEAEIDAWIDSIGTDNELPPPRSGR